ncbi:Hyphally regulated cell wall protein, partial [Spathaspora sp. JA1]
MLKVFLILWIQSTLAFYISNSQTVSAPPYSMDERHEYYITDSGSLTFEGFDNIIVTGNFDNSGTFVASTSGSENKMDVLLNDGYEACYNRGKMTFYARNEKASKYELSFLKFENTGELIFDSQASIGSPETFISASSWVNKGTIIVKNRSGERGIYEQGIFLSPSTNSGTIKLYNQTYSQTFGHVFGDGIIYLEDDSIMEFDPVLDMENRLYMGRGATLRMIGYLSGKTYRVENFSQGNRIRFNFDLKSFNYYPDEGRLRLTQTNRKADFMIGKDYKPELFEFEQGKRYVTYNGPSPRDNFHQEEPASTTYTTIIEEHDTTFTAKIEVYTTTDGIWQTQTHTFELTQYTTTYTNNEVTYTAQVIVSTDDQGNWYTATSDFEFTEKTITYTDGAEITKTGEFIVSTDPAGDWYTTTSDFESTLYTATYTDGAGNTKTGEVVVATDPA